MPFASLITALKKPPGRFKIDIHFGLALGKAAVFRHAKGVQPRPIDQIPVHPSRPPPPRRSLRHAAKIRSQKASGRHRHSRRLCYSDPIQQSLTEKVLPKSDEA